jgi:hypothetical protein
MTDFDRLVGRAPANVTAAQVVGRGEHWTPANPMPPDLLHWDAPPPMKPFVGNPVFPDDVDMTGKKFGRFTVVGFLADSGGRNRGGRWVVRCACGDYEAKSAKAIRQMMSMTNQSTPGFHAGFARNGWRRKTDTRERGRGRCLISRGRNSHLASGRRRLSPCGSRPPDQCRISGSPW